MPGRTRGSSSVTSKGTGGRFGEVWGGGNVWSGNHSCSDVVGSGDNAPLNVFHETVEGGRITIPYSGFFSAYFDNYRCDMLDGSNTFAHLGVVGDPFDVDAATQAAARTNPSRPYVDAVANALQLGELATLIRDSGRSFIRSMGNNNLMYQFGIVPLVGDVVKMINFSDQVNRRVGEINRLRSQRGLRRTVSIGSYSASETQNRIVQSQGAFLGRDFNVVTTIAIKAHCRWIPDGVPSSLSSSNGVRRLARQAVLGLTFDNSTMWELIPWTWLIDWGTNFGQYFTAHRNIIPATLSDVSVMRHTRTVAQSDPVTLNPGFLEGIKYVRENKTRATSFVAPTAHMPFLSATQMGIVASLAVTRL